MPESFNLSTTTLDALFAEYEDPGDCYDSPTLEIMNLLNDLTDCIECPTIGVHKAELVFYDSDSPDADGYILAIRPASIVPWLPGGVQISSTWQETRDLLDLHEDGTLDLSAQSMRKALTSIINEANGLLPYLQRLAPQPEEQTCA